MPSLQMRDALSVPPGKATTQGALVSMCDAGMSNPSPPVPEYCRKKGK